MSNIFKKYGKFLGTYIVASVVLWIVMFIAVPQILIIDYSLWNYDEKTQAKLWDRADKMAEEKENLEKVLKKEPSNLELKNRIEEMAKEIQRLDDMSREPSRIYSFKNYEYLLTNTLHRNVFLKTIWSSVLVTIISLLVCYPIAFYLASSQSVAKSRLLLFAMLIIPYWVDELLRTFAWYMILSESGIMNNILIYLGVVGEPINFFKNNSAALIGMVYAYILFMLLPIYNTLESLDKNQILAAEDLGASWITIHRKIVIPYARSAIAVGSMFVFMLTAGTYAVPSILGGTSGIWFTQIIYSWFFDGGNWNQGATYGIALLVLCISFIMIMLKVFKIKLEDVAK